MRTTGKHLIWNGLRKTCAVSAAVWMAVLPARLTWAGPSGEQVVNGDVAIDRAGSHTSIQAGDNSIIQWQSFDIQQHESVQFVQPNAQSRVMNRVLSVDPTVIAGSLSANGQVYILNQAGVFFGGTAIVDVGGLYAAAGSLSNADFLNQIDNFTALSGSVENWGEIRGDVVALLGQHVANHGTITAADGLVAMVSGDEVRIGTVGGSISVVVAGGTPDGAGVVNTGSIDAGEGRVVLAAGDLYSLAVEHPGVTRAREIRVAGGEGGVTEISGTLDASSNSGTGGSVHVTGDRVAILDANIDASGRDGGGEILIGGDYQGAGELRNADRTLVDAGSSLIADATEDGDGGRVIVWADGVTAFAGDISARGTGSGDGGFAEVSGKQSLIYQGYADLGSETGTGTLLLDPGVLTVTNGGPVDLAFPGNINVVNPADGTVAEQTLENQAPGTAIMLQATDEVRIDPLTGDGVLNLQTDATGSFTVTSGGVFTMMDTANTIQTAGGPVNISGTTLTVGALNTNGGAVSLTGTTGVNLGNSINAGAGDVIINNPVTLNTTSNATTVAGGNVTFNSTIDSIVAGEEALIVDTTGNGVTTFGGAVGGTTSLSSVMTNADGTTSIGNNVTTTGNQTYNDAVTLTGNSVLAGTTPTFAAAGAKVTGGGNDLTLTFSGLTSVDGQFTGIKDLKSDGVGTTNLSGTITTSGTQTYDDGVDLLQDTVLTSTGVGALGNITFSSTVDTEGTQAADRSLMVNTEGTTSFNGHVGNTKTLSSLTTDLPGTTAFNVATSTDAAPTVRTSGVQTYNDEVTLGAKTVLAGTTPTFAAAGAKVTGGGNDLTLTFSGMTSIDVAFTGIEDLKSDGVGGTTLTGNITTSGIQTYDNAVTLGGAVVAESTGNKNISFAQNVTGAAFDLEVKTSGETRFGTAGMAAAQVSANSLTTNMGGSTNLNATITTAGTQTYNDDVKLIGNTTLAGTVVELNKVDGPHDLGIAGNATLKGAIGAGAGATDKLSSLQVGGTTSFGATVGDVKTTGTQLYFDDATLSGDTRLEASKAQFLKKVLATNIGMERLDVTGGATFVGDVGEVAKPLEAVTVTGDTILPSQVFTTVEQSYGSAANSVVNLPAGGTTLTTGTMATLGTVAGKDRALDVKGNAVFNGAIGAGANAALSSVSVMGTTALNGGSVTTTGNQTYDGTVTLGAATTTLTGDTPSFGGAPKVTGGGNDLTLTFSGMTSIDVAFTGIEDLKSDGVGGTTLTGNITTSGSQTYDNAVTLGGSVVAESTGNKNISFAQNVTGAAFDLEVKTSGETRFGTAGMAAAQVSANSLTTNMGGSTNLNATITTAGTQTYNDDVKLIGNTTMAGTVVELNKVDGPHDLGIAGNATLKGAIGAGAGATDKLSSLQVGGTTSFGATVGDVKTTGTQLYTDDATLSGDTRLEASKAQFLKKVLATNIGMERLDVTGGATFVGDVGEVAKPLEAVTVTGDTILPSQVFTTVEQSYGSAANSVVNLPVGGTTLTTGTMATLGTVAGKDRALDVKGNAVFNGAIGAGANAALSSVSVMGTTALNGGSVTTTGNQIYNDDVLLNAAGPGNSTTLTGSGVTFVKTVRSQTDGEEALVVDTTGIGTTTFGGAVGDAGQRLASLTTNADGTTALNGGSVTTVGAQLYNDDVLLNAAGNSTTLTGSGVTFAKTVRSQTDGEEALMVVTTGTGTTTFGGAVGDAGQRLASLTTDADGTTALNGGSVTTVGAQIYNDDVLLNAAGNSTTLTGSGVTFAKTVRSQTDGEEALMVVTTGTGTTTFGGAVGDAGQRLASLTTNADGTTALNGGSVTTVGAQIYNDDVLLNAAGNSTTLTGSGVTFAKTVRSQTDGEEALMVVTTGTGTTTFGGAVGDAGQRLASLTTDADGTTALNGGSVTTVGAQIYNDDVLLNAAGNSTTLTGSGVTFAKTVRSQTDGEEALVVATTGTGTTTFGGAVGDAGQRLASLTTNADGTTALNGGAVTTVGAQFYNDDVLLNAAGPGNSTTLTGSGVTFAKTVRSQTDGEEALMVVTTGTGTTTFGGAVGDAGQRLASLTTDADGTTALNGGSVTTTGNQIYNDDVLLNATGPGNSTTLTGSGVTFAKTVRSQTDGEEALVVATTGTGTTTFGGAVGDAGQRLASLTTNADGTTALNGGAVTTVGAQLYNDDVLLNAAGPGNSTTLTGSGVTFAKTVRSQTDGEEALVVATTGNGTTTFGGAVGDAGQRLASLTTNADGTTALNGGSVTTVGAQLYNDDVLLNAAGPGNSTTLTGSGVTFAKTVRSQTDGEEALVVVTTGTGTTTFGGAVGDAGQRLASLTTDADGTTALNGGSVTTTGNQLYNDDVLLNATGPGNSTTLTGSGVTFAKTVRSQTDGEEALVVDTTGTGTTTFGGAVGDAGQRLASLTTNADGTTALNGGAVTTVGAQLYNDDVLLNAAGPGNSTTLTGSGVTFAKTVRSQTDGEEALVVATTGNGTTTFGGAVGDAGQRLASLTTNADGTTALNGGSVTTVGAQLYNDNVALGKDSILTGGTDVLFSAAGTKLDAQNNDLTVDIGSKTAIDQTFANMKNLKTQGAGTTDLAGTITTGESQAYDNDVTLGGAAVVTSSTGDRNISFAKTVTGLGTGLTVDTGGTTSLNGVVNIGSLTTDADGTTQLNTAGVTTATDQIYNDLVVVGAGTKTLNAGGAITFGNDVNGPGALVGNAGAGLASDMAAITFNGKVGAGGNPLESLTLQTNDQHILLSEVTTVNDLNLNANARTNPSQIATIYNPGGAVALTSTSGNVAVGGGERITALGAAGGPPGNVTISSGSPTGKVTIADVSGNVVTIKAKTLEIQLRNAGPVLQSNGAVVQDAGVDIVGNAINLNGVGEVKLIGAGKATFGTPTRAEISPQPVPLTLGGGQSVSIRAINNAGTALTRADLVRLGVTLDAVPLGPEQDLNIFVAGLVPTVPEPPEPPDPGPEPPKAEDVLAWLNCAQLSEGEEVPPECQPDVAAGEADEGTSQYDREEFQAADAINALELYRALLRSPETVEAMRGEFQTALSSYERDTQTLPMTGVSFRQYVQSHDAHSGALDFLDQLAFLFDRLRTMDLLPGEFQSLREALLQELVEVLEIVDRATPEEFGEAIDASRAADGAPTAWLLPLHQAGRAGAGR